MNIPLNLTMKTLNCEQKLDSPRAVVGINKANLTAINLNRLINLQRYNEIGRNPKDFDEKFGGDGGAIDDAFGPRGGEAGVVVGVEVGEEVGDGEVAGVAEGVDEEAGFGDEFGVGERWRERERGSEGE